MVSVGESTQVPRDWAVESPSPGSSSGMKKSSNSSRRQSSSRKWRKSGSQGKSWQPPSGHRGSIDTTSLANSTLIDLSSLNAASVQLTDPSSSSAAVAPLTCSHCRYPCDQLGVENCEASFYLSLWDADSHLKPPFFDSSWAGLPPITAGLAVVSRGGRCGGVWKQQNQDTFLLHAFSQSPAIVVGVCDGHGALGGEASRKVRQSMLEALSQWNVPPPSPLASSTAAAAPGTAAPGAGAAMSQEAAEGCLLHAFSLAEQRMAEAGLDFSRSGSTAVLCMLLQDRVVAAWAGDSRAVVGVRDAEGKGYTTHPLTTDHKPDSPAELARIAAAGGRVDRLATDAHGNPIGPYRVFLPGQWAPGLAVSRAFGDTLASAAGVTATPEFAVFPLAIAPAASRAPQAAAAAMGEGRSSRRAGRSGGFGRVGGAASLAQSASVLSVEPPVARPSHLLIIASDGLWEWVSSRRAVEIAARAECAEDAAHALLEAAQKEWAVKYRGRSCDDITVAVAFLP